MKAQQTTTQKIKELFSLKKIVTFHEICSYLKTNARMTIIRKLRELSYTTSYSHRGMFYTLISVPKYSEEGLWNFQSAYFSKYGTLIDTCQIFIKNSESGYTVKELYKKLCAEVKLPLLKLHKEGKLFREKYHGEYVYFSKYLPRRKQQIIIRRTQNEVSILNIDKLTSTVVTDELKAAIILFYSILNEKQRRIYVGLESLKIGYGGDQLISQLFKIDPETVSKGRKELINADFEKDMIRKQGAGRPAIKKKSRK